MKLCETTWSRINSFIEEVKDNLLVEAVYCLCTQESNIVNLEVVAICNQSLHYSRELRFRKGKSMVGNERNELQQSIKDNNMQSEVAENELVIFSEADSGNFTLTMMHRREIIALQTLVSSHILFDRNGRFAKIREEAINVYAIPPFKDTFEIANSIALESGTEVTEKKLQLINENK